MQIIAMQLTKNEHGQNNRAIEKGRGMKRIFWALAAPMLFQNVAFAQLTDGVAVENKHELQPVLSSLVAGSLPIMSYTESRYGGHAIFRLSTQDLRQGLCKIDILKVNYSSPNSPSEAVGAHDPRKGVKLAVESIVAESYFVTRRPSPRMVRCEYVSNTEGFFRASNWNDAQYVIASIARIQSRLARNPELLNIQCFPGFACEALIRDFKFKNGVFVSRRFDSGAYKITIGYRAKGAMREQSSSSFIMSFDEFSETSQQPVKVRFTPIPMPPD